jgi:hypothetical protein
MRIKKGSVVIVDFSLLQLEIGNIQNCYTKIVFYTELAFNIMNGGSID